ncbi:MAG: FISUMP domain-containing protein [Patescibacteria group bacterium]|nr:hypothetical protein [Patescibacteria group bacterium]
MVIAIIGILATLAVVSLQQVRQNARDSKRMADMKQLHTALELFANKYGRYPTTEEWNQGFIGSSTENIIFMQNIPSAPTPADGDCLDSSNTYIYIPQNNGATYTINFCTGKQVSDLPEGAKQMTPGGIIFGSSELGGEETPVWTCGDDFTDTRDGNIYPTVQIGTQCWFAKNLAYLPAVHSNTEFETQGINSLPGYGVYDYNGSDVNTAKTQANYSTYGVLYNWYAVDQGYICPTGWHVPTHDEFTDLERSVCVLLGNIDCETKFPKDIVTVGYTGTNEGDALKSESTHAWCNDVLGCEESYFSALPSGCRIGDGSFSNIGSVTWSWSSSIYSAGAWSRYLSSSHSAISRVNNSKTLGFFVRCLRTE